jgi:galactose mutarotase-like enzyme
MRRRARDERLAVTPVPLRRLRRMLPTLTAGVAAGTFDGHESLELSAGDLSATFLPGLGMVGASLRHAGDELLDRQAGLRAYAERGAVMGLPLLHPWANRLAGDEYAVGGRTVRLPAGSPPVHRDEHGLPIHGLLAGSPHWRAAVEGPRLRASLDFGAHPELLAGFPFPHELTIEATLSPRALTMATTLRATGDVAVPVSFGYHPYLRLPDVDRTRWQLTLPPRRPLVADARGMPVRPGLRRPTTRLPLGDLGFDHGYDRLEDGAAFRVAGGDRAIAVTLLSGYPAAQIFTPPGGRFICFEPMTAPTNALRSGAGLRTVARGESFTATFAIEVAA